MYDLLLTCVNNRIHGKFFPRNHNSEKTECINSWGPEFLRFYFIEFVIGYLEGLNFTYFGNYSYFNVQRIKLLLGKARVYFSTNWLINLLCLTVRLT